ncbi:MAG TPA: hypothetical protein VLA79_05505 [Polyangia bacterium]|nr:hypothetical protein [Polyangia bacterium]
MTISGGGPAQMQQYKVTGTVNGHQQDMTSQVSYSTSPSGVVNVDSGGLAVTTGTTGGIVTVTATSGTVSATATLTVNYTFVGPDPGMASSVPTNAPGLFTTTTNDASRAPQLIYPNDGVLFPPNVSGIEIHFTPGAGNTIFEVDLLGQISSVKSYIRCTAPTGINGCIYLPDPGLWASVAQANAGQGQVQLFIRGTDDNGTSVGASQTFHLQFSKDDIMGALYYWTTSGQTAIMRWDFGGSTKTAVQYLTPTNTDGSTCVGCHALSSDGTKLVASAGGQNDGRLLLWDVSTNMPQQAFPLTQKSQFESWSSDGSQFVGIYGDANPNHKGPVNLMLFDGNTGAVTQTIDLGGLRADHPDWSKNTSGPDTIAFTSVDPTASTTDQRPATGGIDFIQQTGGAWGQPQTLVPSQLGKNRYYPAIAPDGNLVIYDESTCTSGTPKMGQAPDKSCDADTDMTATVFLTSLTGATPVALANANGPGVADMGATALTNSFPKWAPFIEQLDEMRQVVWFTFSSTRQYGLRSPPAPANTGETTKGTLIWMVGMVLGPGGADPSFTAFCLPFQDITTSNHIAQWAKTFVNIIVDKP